MNRSISPPYCIYADNINMADLDDASLTDFSQYADQSDV